MLTKKSLNTKNLLFINQVITSGVNFSIAIILSRTFGPELFGDYSLLWLVPLFLISIQQSVITSPLYSIGVKFKDQKQTQYISFLFLFLMFTFVIYFLITCISFYFLTECNLFTNFHNYIIFIFICSCCYLLQDFCKRVLVYKNEILKSLLIDVVAYVPYFIVVFYYFFTEDLTINRVFKIFSIFFLISSAIGLLLVNIKRINYNYFVKSFYEIINYSKWLLLSNLIQLGSGNFFLIMTASLLGSSALGGLRIIQTAFGLFNIIFATLDNIYPMKFSDLHNSKKSSELISLIKKIIIKAILALSIILLVYPLSIKILTFIVGNEYLEYTNLYVWFSFITFFIFVNKILSYLLRSIDFTFPILLSYSLNFLFSFFFASYLINNFGLNGTSLGMLFLQINMIVIIILSIYLKKNDSTHYFRKAKVK